MPPWRLESVLEALVLTASVYALIHAVLGSPLHWDWTLWW